MHGLSKHLHKKDGITCSFCTGIPSSILCGEKKLIMSMKCQYLPSTETFFWYFVWCLSRQVFEVILTWKTVTSHGKACIGISYPLWAEPLLKEIIHLPYFLIVVNWWFLKKARQVLLNRVSVVLLEDKQFHGHQFDSLQIQPPG